MIVTNTKAIIHEYGAYPKKQLGQNFIINAKIIEKIIAISDIKADDNVIEIGPGLGALTEFLCMKAKKVLCYEIDSNMVTVLNQTLKQYDNKKIIEGDVLKQDISNDIEVYFGKGAKVKVVANLPYYISTPIFFKLFKVDNIISETFMVQKEMADRFCGQVGSRDYNALSVFVQYYTNTTQKFIVEKNNFYPIPQVDSAVIGCVFKPRMLNRGEETEFLKFVKICFIQKRKTLVNNIYQFFKMTKTEVGSHLEEVGYDSRIRSEQLSVADFHKIYNYLEKCNED
ncbi:MAG: 16S rRNA (adenine(1518)-N(6)/adenine(1519)-N(6))-dimethyltransferase RsmA [Bacilli bacterium]